MNLYVKQICCRCRRCYCRNFQRAQAMFNIKKIVQIAMEKELKEKKKRERAHARTHRIYKQRDVSLQDSSA